ncbi:hypothetical protein MFLAVUS_003923 [Mucor flavus]|uniref:Kinesin-like protein n=1 Tax=Mucor flavus TaxID=439312 RepID=A0ABP9YUI9_9FUNG
MGTETEPGVIPRSVDNVFSFIKKASACVYTAVTREFLLRVSYLEIYNESIRDLLNPSNTNLKIQQDKIRGVYVTPLTEEVVTSPQDVLNIISQGEANRHISSTDYNLHSSRSHTLFQMIIESREKTNSTSTTYRRTLTQSGYGVKSKERVKISQLNLIDLAGSEKAATNEDRRKEGSYINKSLLTLGTVISKLTETSGNKSPGHIPFRDSKLTRILQTALTGLAKVAVICTISPALQSIEESLNTLKFATRVKKISIHAKNDDVMDDKALIQKYRNEILQLKTKLKEQEDNGGLSQNERRDHEQTLKQMRGVRDTLKERIDQLTKLILTSASIVVQQNDQDDIVIVEANPSHIKKEQSAVIYQLEQQVKKLSIDSHQKDERIQQLEHQLRLQSAISAQLETALSITKAELEVNQLKTPISERKYYLGSPPQEEESSF